MFDPDAKEKIKNDTLHEMRQHWAMMIDNHLFSGYSDEIKEIMRQDPRSKFSEEIERDLEDLDSLSIQEVRQKCNQISNLFKESTKQALFSVMRKKPLR